MEVYSVMCKDLTTRRWVYCKYAWWSKESQTR